MSPCSAWGGGVSDLFEIVDRGATFSGSRLWRYRLWRIWDLAKPVLVFVMLNPSTADEDENDPTVERCERRARREGFGGVAVYNVFAFVATDPRELKTTIDPVGPLGTQCLRQLPLLYGHRRVVCAWGRHAGARGLEVASILSQHSELWCLGLNRDGSPKHPLYLPNNAPMTVFRRCVTQGRSAADA